MVDVSTREPFPVGASTGKNPKYGVADRKGFVGVDPVYANFANDTDEPLEATPEVVEEQPKTEPVKAAPAAPKPPESK
jgi:hypothetical protein